MKRVLLDADVNLKVTNQLVEAVKDKAVGMKLVDGELHRTSRYLKRSLVSVVFCCSLLFDTFCVSRGLLLQRRGCVVFCIGCCCGGADSTEWWSNLICRYKVP